VGGRLESIQVLRAVAALLVLFAHAWPQLAYYGVPDAIPNFTFGAIGVDLFFVISGFIMVYTSEPLFGQPGAWRAFAFRRLLRVVPMYWALTTVLLILWCRGGGIPSYSSVEHVVGSYLFLPVTTNVGTTEPLLGVGWTLNHEMFFYALFACTIALHRRLAVLSLTALIIAITALPTSAAPWSVWASPYLYEFAAGMWIAAAMREGVRIPLWLATAVGLLGLYLAVASYLHPWGSRVETWGPACACIVAAVALASGNGLPFAFRPLVIIGDASYALYLAHTLVPTGLHVLKITALIGPAQHPWVWCAAFFVGSIVVALVLNEIDQRCRRAVLAYLTRPRLVPAE
jgi:exopolysaccharide production protein ExoZ